MNPQAQTRGKTVKRRTLPFLWRWAMSCHSLLFWQATLGNFIKTSNLLGTNIISKIFIYNLYVKRSKSKSKWLTLRTSKQNTHSFNHRILIFSAAMVLSLAVAIMERITKWSVDSYNRFQNYQMNEWVNIICQFLFYDFITIITTDNYYLYVSIILNQY